MTDIPRQREPLRRFLLCALFVVFTIAGFWCYTYRVTSLDSLQTPINYKGDTMLNLAIVKAYQHHEIPLFGNKEASHLNAPFGANWNDWPITEDPLFYTIGLLAREVGLFPAFNLAFLFAALLSGFSFFLACYYFRYDLVIAMGPSVAFALPTFYWLRGPGHMALQYYWCIPLLVSAFHYLYHSKQISLRHAPFWLLTFLAFFIGIQNPYYSWMSAQLLGLSLFYFVFKSDFKKISITASMLTAILAGFILCNADTLLFRLSHGPNEGAVTRSFASLDFFALKIPGLFLPPPFHQWHSFSEWAQIRWYDRGLAGGEAGSPYLGVTGILGLFSLIIGVLFCQVRRTAHALNFTLWHALWIILYSVSGGLTTMTGVAGFALFRCANRLSMFILCYSLIFATSVASRYITSQLRYAFMALTLFAVYFDQCPSPRAISEVTTTQSWVDSDRSFAIILETAMENHGMVFQLPIVSFPEHGPVHQMVDYEHFRPYLFTTGLSYTYGNNKGRHDEDWQENTAALPAREMVDSLENQGFSCICINRNAYLDRGEELLASLRETGLRDFRESAAHDLVAVFLAPRKSREIPMTIYLGHGFYGWERSAPPGVDRWSWCVQTGDIVIRNPSKSTIRTTFNATLIPYVKQTVTVAFGSVKQIVDLEGPTVVTLDGLELAPGGNVLTFSSTYEGERPNTGDPRILAFRVLNPAVTIAERIAEPGAIR